MEILDRILESSVELFMKYGVRSVSMDDISKGLGVSKKTLYSYIDNKGELIEKVIRRVIKDENGQILKIKEEAPDAVSEMMAMANYVIEFLRRMKPSLTYDLKKYYPTNVMVQDLLRC